MALVVVAEFFNRRQPQRLRGIAQAVNQEERSCQADNAWKIHAGPPAPVMQAKADNPGGNESTQVVGHADGRPPGAALRLRIPVGQAASAGRPSKALKESISPPKDHEDPEGTRKSKEHVAKACQEEAERHEIARIGLVGQHAADEFAHAIGNGENASQQSQLAFVEAQVGDEPWHDKGETAAGQIIEGVADQHRVENALTPVLIILFNLFSVSNLRQVRSWAKDAQ